MFFKVFMMGGRWPYTWCFVGCCHQDLFNIARSIRQLHKNAVSNIEQVLAATPPQSTNYTATNLPSWKLSKLDEPDMQDTAGEAGNELISDVLLWTPTYGRAKAGRAARPYIQQLCEDTEVALKTHQRRWMIGRSGERGSGISIFTNPTARSIFKQSLTGLNSEFSFS